MGARFGYFVIFAFEAMICLLTDIPFDALLTLLSYCEPLTILLGISCLSHHLRIICLNSDALWKEQCHNV